MICPFPLFGGLAWSFTDGAAVEPVVVYHVEDAGFSGRVKCSLDHKDIHGCFNAVKVRDQSCSQHTNI